MPSTSALSCDCCTCTGIPSMRSCSNIVWACSSQQKWAPQRRCCQSTLVKTQGRSRWCPTPPSNTPYRPPPTLLYVLYNLTAHDCLKTAHPARSLPQNKSIHRPSKACVEATPLLPPLPTAQKASTNTPPGTRSSCSQLIQLAHFDPQQLTVQGLGIHTLNPKPQPPGRGTLPAEPTRHCCLQFT